MGEPLANYEATVSALRAIVDPHRLGLSARRVTVSTETCWAYRPITVRSAAAFSWVSHALIWVSAPTSAQVRDWSS